MLCQSRQHPPADHTDPLSLRGLNVRYARTLSDRGQVHKWGGTTEKAVSRTHGKRNPRVRWTINNSCYLRVDQNHVSAEVKRPLSSWGPASCLLVGCCVLFFFFKKNGRLLKINNKQKFHTFTACLLFVPAVHANLHQPHQTLKRQRADIGSLVTALLGKHGKKSSTFLQITCKSWGI